MEVNLSVKFPNGFTEHFSTGPMQAPAPNSKVIKAPALPFPSLKGVANVPTKQRTTTAAPVSAEGETGTTLLVNQAQLAVGVWTWVNNAIGESVATISYESSKSVEFPPGTFLYFASNDSDEVYDLYETTAKPGEEPTKYLIYPSQKPVNELGPGWNSVPNFDSCLHGYNIKYMDPFVIDVSDGKKNYVYEPLASTGRDYDIADGQYYFKRGFGFNVENIGWGTTKTTTHYSENSFKNGFTAGISGGVDNAGVLSLGYSTMTSDVKANASMYTTSFQETITYNLTVDREIAKLHLDFVDAVSALPYDASVNDNTTYADLTADMQSKLTTFIKDFGTHTSDKMTFGGYYGLVTSMTEEDVKTSTQQGVNIGANASVPVDGVEVSGSGSGSVENLGDANLKFSATVERYVYRGGAGGADGWGGTEIDDSQALKVDLIRLHEILVPDYFPTSSVPTAELASKKKALELAITNEIGSPYDANTLEIKPIQFRITATSIKLTNASSHVKSLCGTLYMKPSAALNEYNDDTNAPEQYKLFDMSESSPHDWHNNESYVFSDHDIPNVATFTVPFDKIGNADLNVEIYGNLAESDKGSSAADSYNLKTMTIKLGGIAPEDYWVDLNFGKVTHETTGSNGTSKDGIIHVYADTDWVSDDSE